MQQSFIPFISPVQPESRIELLRSLALQDPLSGKARNLFRAIIYDYYATNKRSFDWRQNPTPYNVVVSEVMLQQTQTDRVAPKFKAFIDRFPTFQSLATSSFHDVLAHWKGLGYNRRALGLQAIAQRITDHYDGQLPNDVAALETFPNIGPATARSMTAFAFNAPTVFIETNIRTVFIYFFKSTAKAVSDKELMPIIEQSLDKDNPREWYYALMDYGVMLKKSVGNVSQRSAHYKKQSPFIGSDRQLRGHILQVLLDYQHVSFATLLELLDKKDQRERIERIIEKMKCDTLIIVEKEGIKLATGSTRLY